MKNNGIIIAYITWIIVLILRRFINLNLSYEVVIWFLIYFVIEIVFKLINKNRIKLWRNFLKI